jgi:hypothetical protein
MQLCDGPVVEAYTETYHQTQMLCNFSRKGTSIVSQYIVVPLATLYLGHYRKVTYAFKQNKK